MFDPTSYIMGKNSMTNLKTQLAEIDRRVLASFPHDIESGNMASFSDGADNIPVISIIVDIPITQSGSGEASPSNVRPFSSWTGCEIIRAGEDLYQRDTYTIEWADKVGSVYAGTLDVTAGSLTSDWIQAHGTIGVYSVSDTVVIGMLTISNEDGNVFTDVVSSHFSTSTPVGTIGRCSISSNKIYFMMPRSVAPDGTVAQIEDWIQTNNVIFLVKGSTAFSWQLDSIEIQTLLGVNNIWTNIGDVIVNYRADPTLYINKKM